MKVVKSPEGTDEAVKDLLLQLIEEGDPTIILSSEYSRSLNELIKFEFIAIENERLQLTEKGKQAQLLGVKAVMEKKDFLNEEVKVSDSTTQKLTDGNSNQSFLIVLLFFLISLLAMISLIAL